MPFLEDANAPVEKFIGTPELAAESGGPEFKEQLRAAYRTENTIGSFIAMEGGLPDSKVTNPSFNPVDYLTEDEVIDDRFMDHAALADNVDEIEALRRQRDRENQDREILAQGGLSAMFLASVADPINLIPVGGATYRTYKTGGSILEGARVTALAAAGSTGLTEVGLQYSQIERTYGESAVNIGAAGFLGGILGMAPGALSKTLSDNGIDEAALYKDIENSLNPESAANSGLNPSAPLGDLSMGAAQVMDDPQVRGKLARVLTKTLGFDPLSRTITSDLKSVRLASNRLAENPVAMEGGLARTSVESKIKIYDGFFYKAADVHHSVYKDYRKNGGTMSRKEFNEEVGKALRNGSPDESIQKAADAWRKEVYEPIKNKAIEAKLLPEDVEVSTAEHYLNRVWNAEKINREYPKFLRTVSDWLMSRNVDLTADDAMDLAGEIGSRIKGSPDGRLPYSYKIGEVDTGGKTAAGSKLSGVFKSRSFDIPDSMVEDFLENDIEDLAQRYIRGTGSNIEIIKEFGDLEMTGVMKDIEGEYNQLLEKAKTAKERDKIVKQYKSAVEDIAAMRDRMLGKYRLSDPNNPWVRMQRVLRDLNYMRLLGGVVAASFPDIARIVMAEGVSNTFRHGLKPLVSNLKGFKMSATEAKSYGVGIDAIMRGRAEILADIGDYSKGKTAFERGVHSMAQKFSSVNLMNAWTAGVKQLHGVTVQSRLIEELTAGKYDPRLHQLGIDKETSTSIAKNLKKHGKKVDGVWVANTNNWENQDLADMWRAAIRNESDRVIIVPGQEKPLFMSAEAGKTFLQFKTFMFSATQRVLIGGLSGRDAHTIQGVLGLTTLGMMSYVFKEWDAGRDLADDPKAWVVEGIDRSGTLGILMEANNTLEKISSNNFGLRPLLGVSAPASRYASRSVTESAFGPSFGLLGDVVQTANAFSNGKEWAESDTRALRRLLPGQNLSIIRQGLDKIESGINNFIGVN